MGLVATLFTALVLMGVNDVRSQIAAQETVADTHEKLISESNERIARLETQVLNIARLEGQVVNIQTSLYRMESKLDRIENRGTQP